ncbi:MAG: hypothetical protein U0640_04425 [Phycisphaerales bacterium]
MRLFARTPSSWKLPTPRGDHTTLCACGVIFFAISCAALWLLGGDLGFWNDDFYLREAWLREGGGIVALPSPTPFDQPTSLPWLWRPALTVGVTTMVGSLWESPRIVHAVMALLHVATALLLGVFLRTSGRSKAVSFCAALLYIALPQHFEAAFWANGFLVGVGTGVLLAVAMLYMFWARGNRSWWMIPLLCIGALCVACTHEQPAGAMIAFPFLYVVAKPPKERWHVSVRAMLLPLILMAMTVALYVFLQAGRQADGGVGGSGQFLPPSKWPRGFLNRLNEAIREVSIESTGFAAWRLGWTTVKEHVLIVAFLFACAAGSAFIAIRKWLLHPNSSRNVFGDQNNLFINPVARRISLALAGLTIAIGSFVPLAMVELTVRPRMLAPVIAGLLIFFATVADRLLTGFSHRSHRKIAQFALISIVTPLTIVGTVCMIGVQRGYQLRWHATQSLFEAMRTKLPDPGPHAVLMPVRCDDWPVQSGVKRFDSYFSGPFYWSYAYASMGRIVYDRDDIDASFVHADVPLVFVASPTHGLRHGPFRDGFTDDVPANADELLQTAGWRQRTLPQTVRWVAWDRVVPFVTRPDGGVDFITELAFRQGGLDGEIIFSVFPPRTLRAAQAGNFDELRWILDFPKPPKEKGAK